MEQLLVPGAASNGWAVTGPRTAGGVALLANAPHLAPTLPSVWYQLELKAPELHASRVTVPGIPFVLIGHNADLAWGFTTAMVASRTERIRVCAGEAVPITIRSTSNGVIVNDILGEVSGTTMDLADPRTSYLLALRTNLEVPDRGVPALYGLPTVETLDQALTAGLGLRRAASNVMAAHREGGIAWRMIGALPNAGAAAASSPSPPGRPGTGGTATGPAAGGRAGRTWATGGRGQRIRFVNVATYAGPLPGPESRATGNGQRATTGNGQRALKGSGAPTGG